MNVLFMAIGDAERASSRLRVHAWEPYLRTAGHDVRIIETYRRLGVARAPRSPFLRRVEQSASAMLARRKLASSIGWADAIVLQEVLPPIKLIDRIKRQGKTLIFDFSDPIHLPAHNGLLAKAEYALRRRPRFRRIVTAADTVFVENDAIPRAAGLAADRVIVMRGPVDTSLYSPAPTRRASNTIRIGWTGSPTTFSYLKELLPILIDEAKRDPRIELTLIGAPSGVRIEGIQTRTLKWSLGVEPPEIAQFDIALYFQPETPWTRFRGGAKLLMYMAAGVPIISSPFGIGDQVVEHGRNGMLARTLDDWRAAIRHLAANPEERVGMGVEARRRAVFEYSYEAYLPRMLRALETPRAVAEHSLGADEQSARTKL